MVKSEEAAARQHGLKRGGIAVIPTGVPWAAHRNGKMCQRKETFNWVVLVGLSLT